MSVKIFADGASLDEMLSAYASKDPPIAGFTTNPTLMRKAGISNYTSFAKEVLGRIKDLPVSFEVFSDELQEMERQARHIASWGSNVFVKIPVTNTRGLSTAPLVKKLSGDGISLNITAVFTLDQVDDIVANLSPETPSIISIFAGRIANAGVDPMPIMQSAVQRAKHLHKCQILWASPREALNIKQAEHCGCHIITITSNLLKEMQNFGKDLAKYSLETVQMFHHDAAKAGYQI